MNKLQYRIMAVDNLKKDVFNNNEREFSLIYLYITNKNFDQGSRI